MRSLISGGSVWWVYAMAGDPTPVLKMFKCIRVAGIFLVRWLSLHAWILDLSNVSRTEQWDIASSMLLSRPKSHVSFRASFDRRSLSIW